MENFAPNGAKLQKTKATLMQPRNLTELHDFIAEHFGDYTPQEQKAANHIVENPNLLAALSMRKFAGAAGVTSYTMIRLFKRLGFSDFEQIKAIARQSLVADPLAIVESTHAAERNNAESAGGLLTTQLGLVLSAAKSPDRAELDRLAGIISRAKICYVLGFRSSASLAQHFCNCGQFANKNMLLLTSGGGLALDTLSEIGSDDVVFAMSFRPYAKMTIKLCAYARQRGARIIAMTDSKLSPLYNLADESIFVQAKGTEYFNSLVGPVIVLERLLSRILALNAEKAAQHLAKYQKFHRYIDR